MKSVVMIVWILLSCTLALSAETQKLVAVTIDDLPGWQPVHLGEAAKTLSVLAGTLADKKIPATGFVIGELATKTADAKKSLESWAQAGMALGNHSWRHVEYSRSGKMFWQEIENTDRILKPLRERFGPWPLAFRFPM